MNRGSYFESRERHKAINGQILKGGAGVIALIVFWFESNNGSMANILTIRKRIILAEYN